MVTISSTMAVPSLQASVDRFVRGLETSHKLLSLHERKHGNPGNQAALSPAIVLGTIAAFEGFAEDFTAVAMANAGSNFAEIAKKIGSWNNPDIDSFANYHGNYFPVAAPSIASGQSVQVFLCPYVGRNTWVWKERTWSDVRSDSRSWMQVRHLLTHGLATGWRSELWPGPLKATDLPASRVLRDNGDGKHSLVIHGAITCARIYSEGAQIVANAVAGSQGQTLDWSRLPTFE
jgi:hypothetical protein